MRFVPWQCVCCVAEVHHQRQREMRTNLIFMALTFDIIIIIICWYISK